MHEPPSQSAVLKVASSTFQALANAWSLKLGRGRCAQAPPQPMLKL